MTPRHSTRAVVVGMVLAFSSGLVTCLAMLWAIDAGRETGARLNESGLTALRPGMSEAEVISRIGPPLCERRATYPDPPASRAKTVWLYTRTGLFGSGLEVTLSVEDGVLNGVYVESSDLLVYQCDRRECPDAGRALPFELP